MYLNEKSILHAVDAAKAFQANQFLNSISARDIQKTLYQCQINTYLGPLDIMTLDIGINFDFIKFCTKAKILGITCHQIPVEAHWSIRKVEKYYAPICQAYNIIQAETRGINSKNAMLQMVFKAINNIAGPNGLIPTLLIFDAYFCFVTDFSPPIFQ